MGMLNHWNDEDEIDGDIYKRICRELENKVSELEAENKTLKEIINKMHEEDEKYNET